MLPSAMMIVIDLCSRLEMGKEKQRNLINLDLLEQKMMMTNGDS